MCLGYTFDEKRINYPPSHVGSGLNAAFSALVDAALPPAGQPWVLQKMKAVPGREQEKHLH